MMAENEQELVSLDEAAKILQFTPLYVRQLVRRGKLKTKKVPLGPASQVWKHMILAKDVYDFKLGTRKGGGVSHRIDGRLKHILYASSDELERVKELLVQDGLKEIADLICKPTQSSAYKQRKLKAAAKLTAQ
jgi:hypothetical protein